MVEKAAVVVGWGEAALEKGPAAAGWVQVVAASKTTML